MLSSGSLTKRKQSVASSCKLELVNFSTLIKIKDRAECDKSIELQKKTYNGRGDTAHTLLVRGTIVLGTPHFI